MASVQFPTYAYSATQPAQLVQTQAALTALGATWSTSPFPGAGTIAPADPGFTDTDIRLQQMLVELRMMNLMLNQGFNAPDDLTAVRAEVVAVDSALTS